MPLTENEQQNMKSSVYNLTNQMGNIERQVVHLVEVINNQAAEIHGMKDEIERLRQT